jgi:hypothetical protein
MRVFLRHLWVLTTEELFDLAGRKRSMLTLLLYLVVLVSAMYWFSKVQRHFEPVTNVLAAAPQIEELKQMLQKFELEDTVDFIIQLSHYPAALWMFQLFSLLWLPTVVGLVSCDMVAIDIDRGTLRFVLQRSSRLAYYLAKLMAHFLLFAGLQLVGMIGLVAICGVTVAQFKLADYAGLGALYFTVAVPFIFFVVASTAWVSSWTRKPMSAIVRLNVLWVVFFIMLGWWPHLSPLASTSMVGLFLPFDRYMWSSVGALTAWGSGFAALGLAGFLRRDV